MREAKETSQFFLHRMGTLGRLAAILEHTDSLPYFTVNAWTQVKWRSSIESRIVSKFPGFVWITVVQERKRNSETTQANLQNQTKKRKAT